MWVWTSIFGFTWLSLQATTTKDSLLQFWIGYFMEGMPSARS